MEVQAPRLLSPRVELDTPGEWFFDDELKLTQSTTCPEREDPNDLDIRVKTNAFGLTCTNNDDVKVEGIDFFASAFDLDDCDGAQIRNSTLLYPSTSKRSLGQAGEDQNDRYVSRISDCVGCLIDSCDFLYTDGAAIEAHGGTSSSIGNQVNNSYFYYIDWSGSDQISLMTTIAMSGTNNLFTNNTMHKTGASATIRIGDGPQVMFNEIYDTAYLQSDGTIIQMMQGEQEGAEIAYNWVHDSPKYGIRMDGPFGGTNSGRNASVHHNVVWNINGGIIAKGDYHNVSHNTAFDSPSDSSGRNDIVVLYDDTGGNENSTVQYNAADRMAGHRSNTIQQDGFPQNDAISDNWNGYDSDNSGETVTSQIVDFDAYDFRPVADSEIDVMQVGAYLSSQTATAPSDPANYNPSTYYWNAGVKRDASNPWTRSTVKLPCTGGMFFNGTSCQNSSIGHYVDGWGLTAQKACGWGMYQPKVGQTHCLESPQGYYVAADVTSIDAGGSHACALKAAVRTGETGSMVHCWGSNNQGQLGDGTRTDLPNNDNDAIRPKWLGKSVFANGTVSQISTGTDYTCGLLNDGSIDCWGSNDYGQIGDGTTTRRLSPTSTNSLGTGRTAISISVGGSHACALLDDGNVRCWGNNANGKLGDGTTSNRNTPTLTASLGIGRTATAIAAGDSFSCAILDDGTVKCWGSNDYGQIGNDGSETQYETPQSTLSLGSGRTANSISAGDNHVCVILDNGDVQCWGRGNQGQLGRGNTNDGSGPTDSPIDLGTGRIATKIAAGGQHTCALLDDGSIKCWGDNDYGQLGDGSTTDRNSPVTVNSLGSGRTATTITASDFSCSILDDGSVKCWGSNAHGQIGNGQKVDSNTPVGILFVGSDAGTEVRKCPVGHFNPGTQRSWCFQAHVGKYVDIEGATSQTTCPSGTTSLAGSDESTDCE